MLYSWFLHRSSIWVLRSPCVVRLFSSLCFSLFLLLSDVECPSWSLVHIFPFSSRFGREKLVFSPRRAVRVGDRMSKFSHWCSYLSSIDSFEQVFWWSDMLANRLLLIFCCLCKVTIGVEFPQGFPTLSAATTQWTWICLNLSFWWQLVDFACYGYCLWAVGCSGARWVPPDPFKLSFEVIR